MTLRIGFDLDGVLADFARAFRETEERVFGPGPGITPGPPEKEEEAQEAAADAEGTGAASGARRPSRRHRDEIWSAIQASANFWETLKPIDQGGVARIHELMLRHKWEVFFVTQRPATSGDTVQRQTQRWLVAQGFDLPSVLVLGGSRGAAARALRLNYHVDDSPQNCIDVISESQAKPILIVPESDPASVSSARALGIGTAGTFPECLDILDQATLAEIQPGLLARLAGLVGWR